MRRIVFGFLVMSFFLFTACHARMIPFSDPALLEALRGEGVSAATIPAQIPEVYSYEGYKFREKTGEYVLKWEVVREDDVYKLQQSISLRINPGEETISVPDKGYMIDHYIPKETGITCYVLHINGSMRAFWVYEGSAYYLGGNLEEDELYAILDTIVIE